jgi:integrase/recombinase XerD
VELKNKTYKNHIGRFQSWLQTLGYAKSTVTGSPAYVNEFLFYLENKEIKRLNQINNQVIKDYFIYLSRRKNNRKEGALSINSLRNNLSALRRFSKYLRETGQGNLEVSVKLPVNTPQIKTILTKAEIKMLYETTDQTILGLRDKAMLSVYYGCGLRRNEGAALDLNDILLDKNKIFIKKGKGYKERFVPITMAIKEDLENYLQNARPFLISKNLSEPAFFVGIKGSRLSGNMLYVRLQQLKEKTGIIKEIGLHTLRHSIATHLLKDGMKIEMVSQFLGHESLESTQIYTHVTSEALSAD